MADFLERKSKETWFFDLYPVKDYSRCTSMGALVSFSVAVGSVRGVSLPEGAMGRLRLQS
jgi:hypothetical protein